MRSHSSALPARITDTTSATKIKVPQRKSEIVEIVITLVDNEFAELHKTEFTNGAKTASDLDMLTVPVAEVRPWKCMRAHAVAWTFAELQNKAVVLNDADARSTARQRSA